MQFNKRIQYVTRHFQRMGLWQALVYFVQRSTKKKGELVRIKLKHLSDPFFLRNKSYDVHIFYQIFIAQELNIDYAGNVFTILDCGANIGLASLYFQSRFPGAKIISIEPDEDNYLLLKKNTNPYINIIPLRTGVYGADCNLFLVDIGEGEASYRVMEKASGYKVMSTIHCRTIDNIVAEFGFQHIDILKMDIEGSEYSCIIANDKQWVNNTRYLLVEFHNNMFPELAATALKNLQTLSKTYNHGEYTIFENCLKS
jgi:FkbM family methyltransferase